jgi:PPOX class probable F420-dependent enzyme
VRRDLPLADLEDFLALPLVAVLATYRRDGSVLLSPVWHRWHDGGFDVVSAPNDVKLRHLRRDPRASLLVYEQEPPYRGVEIRTSAHVVDVHGAAVLRDLAVRYLGAEAGEAYAAGSGDSVLIRLEPGRVRTWDFADEPWSESAPSTSG